MPDCGIKGVRETIEGHIPGGRETGLSLADSSAWPVWGVYLTFDIVLSKYVRDQLALAGFQALVARRARSGAIIHAASVGPSWHRWPMVLRRRMPPSLPCAYMDSDANESKLELEDLCVLDETECYADSSGEARMILSGC